MRVICMYNFYESFDDFLFYKLPIMANEAYSFNQN